MSERVFIKDVRAALMCSQGCRSFFERQGLDWSSFLREGIEITKLEPIDDFMCKQVIKKARERISNGR